MCVIIVQKIYFRHSKLLGIMLPNMTQKRAIYTFKQTAQFIIDTKMCEKQINLYTKLSLVIRCVAWEKQALTFLHLKESPVTACG